MLIITGPTGVGKTEASLLLAERLNGEVVSADSVQVYSGLDVGSDKLPLEQRRGAVDSVHVTEKLFCARRGTTHCDNVRLHALFVMVLVALLAHASHHLATLEENRTQDSRFESGKCET